MESSTVVLFRTSFRHDVIIRTNFGARLFLLPARLSFELDAHPMETQRGRCCDSFLMYYFIVFFHFSRYFDITILHFGFPMNTATTTDFSPNVAELLPRGRPHICGGAQLLRTARALHFGAPSILLRNRRYVRSTKLRINNFIDNSTICWHFEKCETGDFVVCHTICYVPLQAYRINREPAW